MGRFAPPPRHRFLLNPYPGERFGRCPRTAHRARDHPEAAELCKLFGVSPATGSARASEIRTLFGLYQFDPEWCLPSMMEQNPYIWLLEVNGLPMDIRYAPRAAQEEALRRGLIPYLPKTHDEWDSR